MKYATDPAVFGRMYANLAETNPLWKAIASATGQVYNWPKSTYIAEPPFFQGFGMSAGTAKDVRGARVLGIFGDSVTTDHISPAGSIKDTSPAGQYLIAHKVMKPDFNSYGARRGNHEVMMRGTFANVRVKNLMLPPKADGTRVEGGVTLFQPAGEQMPIYDAAMKYVAAGTPTVVFGGEEYGTGSSRDWAAKGTQLLGVKAVVARSFERIHRSNLVGMGVLPCQFKGSDSAESLGLKGDETIDVVGLEKGIKPQMDVTLVIHRKDGTQQGGARAAAHRHPDRGGLLPARRHPALRAARAGRPPDPAIDFLSTPLPAGWALATGIVALVLARRGRPGARPGGCSRRISGCTAGSGPRFAIALAWILSARVCRVAHAAPARHAARGPDVRSRPRGGARRRPAVAAALLWQGGDWTGAGATWLLAAWLPVTLVDALRRAADRWLPCNVFTFIFLAGLLRAGRRLRGHRRGGHGRARGRRHRAVARPAGRLPALRPAARLGRGVPLRAPAAIFVVYEPRWMATFDDARYLRPPRDPG